MSNVVDAILSHIKAQLSQTYTAMPAVVTSVAKLGENKISVQPVNKQKLSDGTVYSYPIMSDVPIQWPAGGGAVMTFPIKEGDDVLLVFSMETIAEWRVSSEGLVEPIDKRIHDLSDAIAIPCVFRDPNNPSPSTEHTEIKFAGGTIRITADGNLQLETASTFSVANSSVELIAKLIEILEAINGDTVNTVYGLSPLNSAASTQLLIDELATLQE